MQFTPVLYPPLPPPTSIINRQQQLTPASSVHDEDIPSRPYRQRSISDPREDDYYFYHSGRGMTSRRSSIQSIGRRSEDDAKAPEQVRLPPITSLFAAVEPHPPPPPPPLPPPPAQYPSSRERQNPQFSPRDLPPQPYYSPPTSYPHLPYRRQSIFSTYSSTPTSSPRISTYPPPSHHPHPPPHHSTAPYRTPSPPYSQRHIPPIPHSYPTAYIQPRPHPPLMPSRAPSSFALSHRTHSASPAERYMCHECNKSFSRPSSLRIHTFSHTGEKPFVCPEPGCNKRFSVRSNMRRHMKVHSEQSPSASGDTAGDVDTASGGGADQKVSVKDEDGISDTSVTSPGQHIPIRPRQGSRSSI